MRNQVLMNLALIVACFVIGWNMNDIIKTVWGWFQ